MLLLQVYTPPGPRAVHFKGVAHLPSIDESSSQPHMPVNAWQLAGWKTKWNLPTNP